MRNAGRGLLVTVMLIAVVSWFFIWRTGSPEVVEHVQAIPDSNNRVRPKPWSADTARTPATVPRDSKHATDPRRKECAFQVVDREGRGIVEAKVWISTLDGKVIRAGVTDDRGTWFAVPPRKPSKYTRFAVEASGYATLLGELPLNWPSRILVTVSKGATLIGRVLRFDRKPISEGARVYAWSGMDPSEREFRLKAAGFPAFHSVPVDREGRFEIHGLTAGAAYSLCAGQPGWVTPNIHRKIRPGGREIMLELWRLFAAIVVPTIEGWSEVPPVPGASTVVLSPRSEEEVLLHPGSVQLNMAGIPDVRGVRRRGVYDWRYRLVAVAVRATLPSLGGYSLRYSVPGFAVTESLFTLPGFQGDLPVYRVPIRVKAAGFGSLRLVLKGAPAVSLPRTILFGVGSLQLVSTTGRGNLRIPIQSLESGARTLKGIPFGSYRARLVLRTGGVFPEKGFLIQVGPSPQELNISMRETGALILNPKSLNVFKIKQLELSYEGKGRWILNFKEPPYLVEGLLKGKYMIRLRPLGQDSKPLQLGPIFITPGKVKRISFG